MRAPFRYHSGGLRCLGRAKQAAFIQQACQTQFSNRFDDARPANPGNAAGVLFGKAGIIRPKITANHAKPRIFRDRINFNFFDRAGGRALPRADLCPFKGRPRGGRTGQNPLLISQKNFGVCSNINDQNQIL